MVDKSAKLINSNFAGNLIQGQTKGNVNAHIESVNFSKNIDEITRMICCLREMAQEFPEAQREEAMVHLEDLEEDITTPEKQKPQRFKTRLVALLATIGTIAGTVAVSADFSNNVLELAEKLGVQIKLSQPQAIQQLPPATPN
jgi:adenine-specific DNA methylase